MIRYRNIRSTIKPEPRKVDDFSVYINTNIHEVAVPDDIGSTEYEYDQIRYAKDEYIQLMAEKNADLESEVSNAQLALCELYEAMI